MIFSLPPGLGFLVKFGAYYFFLTAKHVLRGFDVRDIAVPFSAAHLTSIPLRGYKVFDSVDPDDTDHIDIAVFLLDPDKLQPELFADDKPFRLSLNTLIMDDQFAPNTRLAFKGLSPARCIYDYEDIGKSLYRFGAAIATYDGPDKHLNLIHKLRMVKTVNPPDLDGFSGGPVFTCLNLPGRPLLLPSRACS